MGDSIVSRFPRNVHLQACQSLKSIKSGGSVRYCIQARNMGADINNVKGIHLFISIPPL